MHQLGNAAILNGFSLGLATWGIVYLIDRGYLFFRRILS